MSVSHAAHGGNQSTSLRHLLGLSLASVGVVYGDIGTSPLYAFREALKPVAGDGISDLEVIGLVSLMLWTLTIIVTVKYVLFLLRADNQGEGGTLSLLQLLTNRKGKSAKLFMLMGILGAALFLGDAMITPALSVLSAVEGLKLLTPSLSGAVLPISTVILVLLFAVQARGTGSVSKAFGPITLVWFIVLAAGGINHIIERPDIFLAINPYYAVAFLIHSGLVGVVVLGAVFLTVTGAEALYADLGHFGRKPIQWAWFAVVFPSLGLNYLGQGALVLQNPDMASNPFYLMFPSWALLPVVLLATAATIIASQAVITGAFSLARQAINLGFLPRLDVFHTSETQTGQIYLPAVNTLLLTGVLALVFIFQTSDRLSIAYGIAVTGAMVVTTVMFFDFVKNVWGWSNWLRIVVVIPLLLLEMVFLGANLLKVHDGGYVPIMIATGFVVVMWTWKRGSAILHEKVQRDSIPLKSFVKSIERQSAHSPDNVEGTAIFFTSDPKATPSALLHNIKHNHVLHQNNIIVTIKTRQVPRVPLEERAKLVPLSERFQSLELNFGFMESQNVTQALAHLRKTGLKFDIMTTSFYLGRRKLLADPKSGLPKWQDNLFIALSGFAADPSDYFRLPTNRVVELGSHVTV